MRQIQQHERRQRGCYYCKEKKGNQKGILCPFDECPYKDLDKIESYVKLVKEEQKHVMGKGKWKL